MKLIPYTLSDFVFTGLKDDADRHDYTNDGVSIIPRPRFVAPSARQRFAKRKNLPVPPLDLTDRPSSFESATQNRPDRSVTHGPEIDVDRTKKELSRSFKHLTRPKGGKIA